MSKPFESWLKENSWNLLLTLVGIVAAFTIANYRINAVEAKVAEYPSYDYFELKFKNTDDSITALKQGQSDISKKLDAHIESK